jgi:hypothetical protein
MKPLELQVGKSYKTREGEIIKIVEFIKENRVHNFMSECGDSFAKNGQYDINIKGHNFDLIEEATELNTKQMRPTDKEIKQAAEKYV